MRPYNWHQYKHKAHKKGTHIRSFINTWEYVVEEVTTFFLDANISEDTSSLALEHSGVTMKER